MDNWGCFTPCKWSYEPLLITSFLYSKLINLQGWSLLLADTTSGAWGWNAPLREPKDLVAKINEQARVSHKGLGVATSTGINALIGHFPFFGGGQDQ